MITRNLPFSQWERIFKDPTPACLQPAEPPARRGRSGRLSRE